MRISNKKKQYNVVCFCILVCMFLLFYNSKSRAIESLNSELIILIDISGTMDESWDSVVQWANEIGIYAQNMGIEFHVKCFGDIGKVQDLYNGTIDNNTIEDYIKEMKKLKPNEKWTDQAGAIEEAIAVMKESHADKKCIVMLSDGRLDYIDSDENSNANEEEGKSRFINAVNKFSMEANQSIVLIEFEDGSEVDETKEKYIFTGLDKAVTLQTVSKSSNEGLLKQTLPLLFEKFGLKLNEILLNKEGNQITFTSEKDTVRIIIIIEMLDNIMDKTLMDPIIIKKDNIEIEADISQWHDNLFSLILEESGKGNYIVTLPDGNKKCRGVYMVREEMSDIQSTVIQDETQSQIDKNEEDESESPSMSESTVKVKEKINIKEEFGIEDDEYNEDDEEYYIFIDGEKRFALEKGDGDEEQKDCSYKENYLKFLKEGTYEVIIKSENKCLEKGYYYTVVKRRWFEILFPWLR